MLFGYLQGLLIKKGTPKAIAWLHACDFSVGKIPPPCHWIFSSEVRKVVYLLEKKRDGAWDDNCVRDQG